MTLSEWQCLGSYLEQQTLKVYHGADVIVCGAGPAGVMAALAAARGGARTLLIDAFGVPGGNMTSGLPLLGLHDGQRPTTGGIPRQFLERVAGYGGVTGDFRRQSCVVPDPEIIKLVLLEMLQEAGVELLLHTVVSRALLADNARRIRGVVIEAKGGRRVLCGSQFIDATGDADVAASAGVPCEKGPGNNGKTQSMTLMFTVGNVQMDRFAAWGGYNRAVALYRQLSAAEGFRNPRRTDLSGFWHTSNRPGEFALNVTRVVSLDGTDAKQLTQAEIEGRYQAWEFLNRFLRPHVPGFEQAYMVSTAVKIGVRESRRIIGEYVLTEEDIISFRKFADTIAVGCYPIDIHSPGGDGTRYIPEQFYGGKYYTIPWRCLLPVGLDNLLVAGRCISATHEALSAIRVMPIVMCMGQAAGTAAAVAVQASIDVRHVDVAAIQNALRCSGAVLSAEDAPTE